MLRVYKSNNIIQNNNKIIDKGWENSPQDMFCQCLATIQIHNYYFNLLETKYTTNGKIECASKYYS